MFDIIESILSPKKIKEEHIPIKSGYIKSSLKFDNKPINSGVTKGMAQEYFEKEGHFNSDLYDKIMVAKYKNY